jgi:hypothetical protein
VRRDDEADVEPDARLAREDHGGQADDRGERERVKRAAMPEGRAVRHAHGEPDDVDVGQERERGQEDHRAHRVRGRGAASEAPPRCHADCDVPDARHVPNG